MPSEAFAHLLEDDDLSDEDFERLEARTADVNGTPRLDRFGKRISQRAKGHVAEAAARIHTEDGSECAWCSQPATKTDEDGDPACEKHATGADTPIIHRDVKPENLTPPHAKPAAPRASIQKPIAKICVCCEREAKHFRADGEPACGYHKNGDTRRKYFDPPGQVVPVVMPAPVDVDDAQDADEDKSTAPTTEDIVRGALEFIRGAAIGTEATLARDGKHSVDAEWPSDWLLLVSVMAVRRFGVLATDYPDAVKVVRATLAREITRVHEGYCYVRVNVKGTQFNVTPEAT